MLIKITVPTEREKPATCAFYTADGRGIGTIDTSRESWTLFYLEKQKAVGAIDFTPILKQSGRNWPTESDFASWSQQVIDAVKQRNFLAEFTKQFAWYPLVIAGCYRHELERRARLAIAFLQVCEQLADATLLPAQAMLTRLAYTAVADLYEMEPAESSRLPALEQCFRRLFRQWQPTITNNEQSWLFAYPKPLLKEEIGIEVHATPDFADAGKIAAHREAAMLELLTDQAAEQPPRLRRFFRQKPQGQEAVRLLIERWFLPRYDLFNAERLKKALGGVRHEIRHKPSDPITGYLPEPSTGGQGWRKAAGRILWLLMALYWIRGILLPLGWPTLEAYTPVWSGLAGLVYGLSAIPFLYWLASPRPDTGMPRLVAGILLAAVGAILQQRWDALLHFAYPDSCALLNRFVLLGLGFAFVLAAGKLMLYKVRRATGYENLPLPPSAGDSANQSFGHHSRQWVTSLWTGLWTRLWGDEAAKRTGLVVGRGLTLAFALSLLLVDMFAQSYLESLPPGCCPIPTLPGFFGQSYPMLVFFLTSLLLFSGIFTQFIWEEKALTEAVA